MPDSLTVLLVEDDNAVRAASIQTLQIAGSKLRASVSPRRSATCSIRSSPASS